MFTGIIQGVGKIEKISQNTKNRSAFQMTVDLGKHAKGLKVGQSVALNGVCLSATKISKNKCDFEMIDETIKQIEKKPKEIKVWFEVPKKLVKFVVKKGSIAIDGISLTVVDVTKNNASVCLIPHTIKITNFQSKKVGDKINIETDILGKYILKQT